MVEGLNHKSPRQEYLHRASLSSCDQDSAANLHPSNSLGKEYSLIVF